MQARGWTQTIWEVTPATWRSHGASGSQDGADAGWAVPIAAKADAARPELESRARADDQTAP
jgi:hypothetical protein